MNYSELEKKGYNIYYLNNLLEGLRNFKNIDIGSIIEKLDYSVILKKLPDFRCDIRLRLFKNLPAANKIVNENFYKRLKLKMIIDTVIELGEFSPTFISMKNQEEILQWRKTIIETLEGVIPYADDITESSLYLHREIIDIFMKCKFSDRIFPILLNLYAKLPAAGIDKTLADLAPVTIFSIMHNNYHWTCDNRINLYNYKVDDFYYKEQTLSALEKLSYPHMKPLLRLFSSRGFKKPGARQDEINQAGQYR